MELPTADQISRLDADGLDQLLDTLRRLGAQIRAVEVRVLREVDRRQIPLGDGMRSLEDWIVGRMDVSSDTARRLVSVSRADSLRLDDLLAEDGVSFDRVSEVALAGSTDPHLDLDMAGLRSTLLRRCPIDPQSERDSYESRFLAMQPSLDESAWKLWGRLPALEGKIVASALDEAADALPEATVGHRQSRAIRRADALFAICDRRHQGTGAVNTTVIVDATDSATSAPSAWVVAGPRVGPSTLQRLLCESPIEVIARASDGQPLAVGNASTAISPRTRRWVMARDGGMCAADGCGSSQRLQPHHIRERTNGGANDPENLVSLCWFHHHVVVHGRGFTIDPSSPARRRRFLPPDHPQRSADPP